MEARPEEGAETSKRHGARLRGGLMYGNAFQIQDDRCHLGSPGPMAPSIFAGPVNLLGRSTR